MSILSRTSLTQQVADQLVEFIRTEGLKPGDLIPTTRHLAELFGVNNTTLREALRQLEATGGILLKHGSGIYVGPTLDRIVLANPTSPIVSLEMAIEFIKARLAIEPRIAYLAAGNASNEDLQLLQDALLIAKTPVTMVPTPNVKPNFHRALALASGNQILFEVIDSLLTAYKQEQHAIRTVYADRKRDYEQHLSIFDAISTHNSERASALMEVHLSDILQVTMREATKDSEITRIIRD